MPRFVRLLGFAGLLCSWFPHLLHAQIPRSQSRPLRWELPWFDFRPDGVWRTRARAVRALRARLRATGRFTELNAPLQGAAVVPLSQQAVPLAPAAALSGVMNVPVILLRFKDSPAPLYVPANYDDVLFGTSPTGAAAGRPYTYRSFYQQMSNGLLDIQGQTFGYATLDSNEVYYTGGTSLTCQTSNPFGSTNCNGAFSGTAVLRMQAGLKEAIRKLDGVIDFSQFADTSGRVPLVLFLHEALGGECGPRSAPQNHLWAHRASLVTTDTTNDSDPYHPGQKVKISDYILQPAIGGASGCTAGEIMPIGTVAHETGHGFGLPDLYDTSELTEGIGEWGLMGSGNWSSPFSPTRMEAWSLDQLGWINVVPLTTNGTYSFDAAPLSDTAFYLPVQGANPRSEYFLIENRQRQQADSAVINYHCYRAGNPPGCGGGMLVWHVDAVKMASPYIDVYNNVNAGPIHGLELMQADAFRNLDANPGAIACPSTSMVLGCSNRGDAGDPYPGTTHNGGFVFRTNPASLKNFDSSFAGVAVDSIQQIVTDRTVSFRLRFGALTVVRASDTAATIQFDGTSYNVFRDLLDSGSSHTVGFGDGAVSADGRTRWYFASWSDGGAISHGIAGALAGDTLIATLTRQFKLTGAATSGGSITSDTAINLAGDFIPEGRAVQLTPSDASLRFCGWTGDTTTTDSVISLPMHRPYTVTANFGTTATITSGNTRPAGVMGSAYADTLRISGGGGLTTWTVTGGALPPGVTLSSTGQISGFPRQAGTFSYTATVVSCDRKSRTFTFSVTAPTLVTSDVVAQLLGPTAPLSADQLRYLDFVGNNNGSFDIGDFLAWVKLTGAPLSPAILQAAQRKRGGKQ